MGKQSSAIDWDGPHIYFNSVCNPEFLLPDNEAAKCIVFDCGHSLTRQEQLFGNVCHRHDQQINNPVYLHLDEHIKEVERAGSVQQYLFQKKMKQIINKRKRQSPGEARALRH